MAWRSSKWPLDQRWQEGYLALPQLVAENVTDIDDVDWWDGPLNGFALYEGQKIFFDFVKEIEAPPKTSLYVYLAFVVTPDEYADGKRIPGEWQAEYEKAKAANNLAEWDDSKVYLGPDLTGREPFAWFDSGKNQNMYAIKVAPKNANGDRA